MPRFINTPETKERNFRETLHGTTIHDSYRWLESENAEVSSWVGHQNRFSHSVLSRLPLREKFAKRFKEFFNVYSVGTPYPKNGLYFTMERKPTQDLAVFYVQKGLGGKQRVLIDQNKLSKDKTTTLRKWSVSEDAKLLAYTLSESGNDQNDVYVLDIQSGKRLIDHIPAEFYPAMYSHIEWHPQGAGFWYSRRQGKAPKGEEKLYQKVFYHKLGDNFKKDKLVFGAQLAKDEFPSVESSRDGRYLLVSVLINSGKIRRNEIYVKDLKDAAGDFKVVVSGIDAEFHSWMHRDALFVATNHHAPNWKMMKVPLRNVSFGMKHWKTIIPEGRYPYGDISIVKDRIFIESIENAHSKLRVYDLEGSFIEQMSLPLGTTGMVLGEAEGEEAFFRFTSFVIPNRIYRFDLKLEQLSVLKELKIKGINFGDYKTDQVWFHSKDGTRVPMFLVYKKGIRRSGANPTLLYGYGGFGTSMTPEYSSTRMAFLERGGIFAMPNIRGGGEFGEKWHQAGTKEKKQNSFDDFIAAAEWLVKNKYTDSKHLAAFGWSNGGLLMGAMLTQRPDLFKAVVVGAPVLDMLRFHKFHGGRYWIPDYGNPDDPKMFCHILKYSPYHNVKNGDSYPATLIVTAEGDDRVHPAHAYKFTAKLQKANASANPILITVERKAGHGGAASISNFVNQYADIYGFIAWQIGMK